MKNKLKSIYQPDDARLTEDGLSIAFKAQEFFKEILEKYPKLNPREIVELCSGEFHLLSARRILELRRLGVLKITGK
jgi:hypothetical protein